MMEQLAFSLAFYIKAVFQGCYLNTQFLILKLRLQWSGEWFEDWMLCEGIKLTLLSQCACLPYTDPCSNSFPDKMTIERKCWTEFE